MTSYYNCHTLIWGSIKWYSLYLHHVSGLANHSQISSVQAEVSILIWTLSVLWLVLRPAKPQRQPVWITNLYQDECDGLPHG